MHFFHVIAAIVLGALCSTGEQDGPQANRAAWPGLWRPARNGEAAAPATLTGAKELWRPCC